MTDETQPRYIRYLPAQAGAQPRLIRMVEAQKDPMEPARFKLNQKIPPPPPSPPAPVMHSPPRKTTVEEQSKWVIPPCVSGWKNPRGYTIPLDKRCALVGKNNAQPEIINPKFAQLSEALAIGNRQHRIAIEERAKAERLMAQKEKEKKEEGLRLLAQKAREERAGGSRYDRDDESDSDNEASNIEERRKMLDGRHRERVRDFNLRASNPTKHSRLDRERDISEQIALGMARPDAVDDDPHDQRLYNQSQGVTSGFGDDDDYAVYDQPWKSQASFSKTYRPSDSVIQESKDRELDSMLPKTSSDPDNDVLAPIQFEKDHVFEKDLEATFSVESFLKNAKYNATEQKREQHRSSKKQRR